MLYHASKPGSGSQTQLTQIFLAVDNLKTTIRRKLANVTSVKPAIFIKLFLGLVWHHVVTQTDVATFDPNFSTTEHWISLDILTISGEVRQPCFVIYFRTRNKFYFNIFRSLYERELTGNFGLF